MILTFALNFPRKCLEEWLALRAQLALVSVLLETPQKNRDDFENDRYARECKPAPWVGFGLKSCSNQVALREHREDAKGRKAHFDKISLWNCDLLS